MDQGEMQWEIRPGGVYRHSSSQAGMLCVVTAVVVVVGGDEANGE
jgi:hypothetical protein